MDTATEAATVQYEATTVQVSDERGAVRGARVTYRGVTDTVIPREGDSLECWLGQELCRLRLTRDEVEALASAASRGAEGKSGTVEVL